MDLSMTTTSEHDSKLSLTPQLAGTEPVTVQSIANAEEFAATVHGSQGLVTPTAASRLRAKKPKGPLQSGGTIGIQLLL